MEGSRCFVCGRPAQSSEAVKFEQDEVLLFLHESCLRLLGKIVNKALDAAGAPLPVGRPQSLAEFLKEKKPENQAEILACAAYFVEKKKGGIVEFTTTQLRHELLGTGVRIPDFGIALSNATRRTPYIARIGKRAGVYLYRLTQRGIMLIENLPAHKQVSEQPD